MTEKLHSHQVRRSVPSGHGVVVVGSLNVDLTVFVERLPSPGETVHGRDAKVLPGGKGANQAVAAARLGADVTLIGAVGGDANGQLLVSSAKESGVATDGVRVVGDEATGAAHITVDAHGENTIVLIPGANASLERAHVEACLGSIDPPAVLGLCLEIGLGVATFAAALARTSGATVLTNLSPYTDEASELLRLTDVLLVNEHEAAQLTGTPDASASEVASALEKFGVSKAIITRGGAGCSVLEAGRPPRLVPALAVEVVDTTGCGDAFMGAIAAELALGAPLIEAAEFALTVAGYAAQGRGAQPSYPTRASLHAWTAAMDVPPRQTNYASARRRLTESQIAATRYQNAPKAE
jgi:ribokinase